MRPLGWFCGFLGVSTFFVVSGLIMMRTSGSAPGTPAVAGAFAFHRLVRIVPLYWIATFAYAAAKPDRQIGNLDLLKSLTFTPYFSPNVQAMRPVLAQGWTLNYEAFFYAMFTVCLLLPARIRVRSLLILFLALVCAGSFLRPLVPYGEPANVLEFWTDPIILFFAVGVGIGWLEMRTDLRARMPIAGSLALFAVAAALFWLLEVTFPMPLIWQAVFGIAGIASTLLCTIADEPHPGPLTRLLEHAGDASYSTYLFHPAVVIVCATLYARLPPSLQSPPVFLCVVIVAANVAGFVIFRTIERPLTRALRKAPMRFARS